MSAPSIARSSAVMAAGTLVSRVLGLVRNALLIAALGATASGAADAFNVANMLPTQLYNLIIGGVLNAILVPQIVRALRMKHGEELVNRLLTAAALAIAGVAAVLTIAAPLVIMVYASGLGRWQPLAFAFAFWCMPQIFFYGLYALWGQVLNARHSFGPYMWSPVLNNLISIAAVAAYLHLYGSYSGGQDPGVWDAARIALVGATATAGIAVQALILYIPLVRSGFRPRIILGVRGLGLGQVSKVALWALLGTLIASFGDLAVTNLGSRAVTAAESAEYVGVVVPSTTMYANALMVYMLPQSLVTTSIITALFTRMSEKAAAGDREGVRDDLSLGLRSVGVFTVLFAAGIAALAAPALQLFVPSLTLEQATASGPVLAALAVGIPFQGAWFTTQRVLLAYADTRRLVRADCVVGAVCVGSCVLAYLLAPATSWMALAGAGNALALASACVAIVPLLRRHLPDLDGPRVLATYARLLVAAVPTVLVGLVVRWLIGPADGSLTGVRAGDAAVTVAVAAALMTLTYVLAGRAAGVEEMTVVYRPASRVAGMLGRVLPGGLGRSAARLARFLTPAGGTSGSGAAGAGAGAAGTAAGLAARAGSGRAGSGRGRAAGPTPVTRPDPRASTQSGRASTAPAGPRSARPGSAATQPTTTTQGRTGASPAQSSPTRRTPSRPASQGRYPAQDRVRRPAYRRADVVQDPTGTLPVVADTLGVFAALRTGGDRMGDAIAIGSGRYELRSPLPTSLPRILRHTGRDTILDREVTILSLTTVTPHRDEILEAASRATLVDDARLQRVYDVETGDPSFIITEPAAGPTVTQLVTGAATLSGAQDNAAGQANKAGQDSAAGQAGGTGTRPRLTPAQVRALVGETASVLAHCAQRDLHHEHLTPDAVRVRPNGTIQLCGTGIEAAALGTSQDALDPLAASHADARALVQLLYLGLTGRWPGKLAGFPTAPTSGGAPVPPSQFNPALGPDDSDLDALVARTWSDAAPSSAREVASALGTWDTTVLGNTTHQAGSDVVPPNQPDNPSRPDQPSAAAEAPEVNTSADEETSGGTQAALSGAAGAVLSTAGAGIGRAASGLESAVHRAHNRFRVSQAERAEMAHERANREQAERNDPQVQARKRTTTLVIIVALVAILLGALFAITNLVQLASVKITDDDRPAAQTVPTEIASEQAEEEHKAEDTEQSQAPQEPAPAPITITGATIVDPYGDGEHPELASALVDGSPDTTWYTHYYGSANFNGKQGMGVAISLAHEATISGIDLAGTGSGGHLQVRATTPEDPTGGTLLAEGSFSEGSTSLSWDPTTASSIVVWVTELPTANDGKLKVTIGEITLR